MTNFNTEEALKRLDEARKNFTMRITQANKSELVVILYEMFLEYLEDAIRAEDNRPAFREGIRKARGCINELMNSLDFDYDLSYNLLQLYVYVNKEMASADVRGIVKPLENCRKIMKGLMEAYREISIQDTSGPVMENTQAVYAGLTYGKGKLTESMVQQGNRGFFA